MEPKIKIATAVIVTVLGIAAAAYADIWVDPTSFDVETPEGCIVNETLTIGNNGAGALNFTIRTRQVGSSGENTILSSEPAERDFTKISPNATYRPGRLIVRFAGGGGRQTTMESKNQVLSSVVGARVKKEFQIVPGLSLVELPAGVTVEEALKVFNKTDGILYAEPDYRVTIDSTIPNDTRFGELWGMNNTGQSGGTVDADIDAPEAWDIGTGSSDIIVAVIDTGVDYTHPDLAGNMWVNTGEIPGNGLDDDGNGYIDDIYGYDFVNDDGDPMDDHYHGTHCAGTIGGIGNNNQGVAGVCWDVRIMALKFLDAGGSGWTSDAISAVNYSRLMGAKLSSNSWGGGGYDQGLKDAIDAAGAAGMLFVAAAGNSNTNTDINPNYPSCYDSESLIAVMATDRYDNKSSFSNYGPTTVDLGAPGSEILSCQPGNRYQYLNGTSMATPHVAGACALLWSMNSAAGNVEIKNILIETVDPTLSGQCVSGGRLNLYNAILETRAPWITIEPEEGTVGAGDSIDVNVTFDALELVPGVYEAEIVIISDAPSSPTIIPVTLTVTTDDLQVAPAEDFESSGTRGGPFTPKCMTYTLTNNGAAPVSWATAETESWLGVEPSAGVLDPNASISVDVCITPDANLLTPNIYEEILTFENLNSGSTKQRSVTLMVKPPDCFTELFDVNDNDLEGLMLTLRPDGSGSYYEACREKVEEFPTNPSGGTFVELWDDDYAGFLLGGSKHILLYGTWYNHFYIGSNGYITFGDGDLEYEPSLENHFDMPRISALFTDLVPSNNECISYKNLSDRLAVTFEDVPLYGDKNAKNSFQVEMYYTDGTIRITWLKLAPATCVAGLSEGYGLPPSPLFLESDLSEYLPCWPECDLNRDYYVNFRDFAILAEQWLEEDCTVPSWCGRADMDLSSTVGYNDLSVCAGNWLTADEWWLQPLSHWKFDEGSGTTAHDSAGDNDGTITGATWTTGQINGALSFDGSSDYVTVGDKSNLEQQAFTLSFWAKLNNPTGSLQGGIAKGYIFGSSAEYSYKLDFHLGEARAHITNASEVGFGITGPIGNSDWHMWSMTAGGGTVTLYKDGAYVNSIGYTGTIDYAKNYNNFMIGARDGGSYSFNGKMDDVRFYDRVLSAEEILQLYQGGLGPKASNPHPSDGATDVDPNGMLGWSPGKDALSHDVYLGIDFNDVNNATPGSDEYKGNYDVNTFDPCGLGFDTTYYWRIDERSPSGTTKGDVWSFTTWVEGFDPNLVRWWKFDESSGNIAHDSASGSDGTVYGATWTTGQINGALSFDGSNDYVSIPSYTVSTNNGTIELWFETSANFSGNYGGMGYLISRNSQYYSYLTVGGDGSVPYWIIGETNSQDDYFVSAEGVAPVGQWNHLVVSFDNKQATTYLNGDFVWAEPVTNSSLTLDRIGGRTSEYFNGKIDDVRIYSRALSAGEVEQLYLDGL